MIEQEKHLLNDGHLIPKIGLGTFQIRGYEGVEQILTAIQSGYRLLDTSTIMIVKEQLGKQFAVLAYQDQNFL